MSDPIHELSRFDIDALKKFVARSPDPFLARLINISGGPLHGSLLSAVDKNRIDRIKSLMESDTQEDPEKDQIVRQGAAQITQILIKEKAVRRDGIFYLG